MCHFSSLLKNILMNLFVLFSLFSSILCYCNFNIDVSPGAETIEIETEENNNICINTTFYPTYLLIDSFADDTEYIQYNSIESKQYQIESNAILRFLPMYQNLEKPFSSSTIFTPSPTNVTISIISLPGLCNDGVYFSNKRIDSVKFSKYSTGFESLEVYDDKCLIFTSSGNKNATIEISSNDNEDQLFVYYSYDNYTSISGNNSFSFEMDENNSNPLIFRIIADDKSPPEWTRITIETDGDEPRNEMSDYYTPVFVPPTCDDSNLWYNEQVAIVLIVITVLLFILCLYAGRQCIKSNKENNNLLSAAEGYSFNSLSKNRLMSVGLNEIEPKSQQFQSLF